MFRKTYQDGFYLVEASRKVRIDRALEFQPSHYGIHRPMTAGGWRVLQVSLGRFTIVFFIDIRIVGLV